MISSFLWENDSSNVRGGGLFCKSGAASARQRGLFARRVLWIAWLAALCMVCTVWGPISEAAAQNTTLSLSGPADANEGDSGARTLTYTVTLSQAVSSIVEWKLCFSGTATYNTAFNGWSSGADYRTRLDNVAAGTICFLDDHQVGGALANTDTDIQVRGDTNVEPNETVIATLTLTGTPPAGVTLGTSTHTHTILNDDTVALPEVTIAAGSSVTEGADASFTVTASPSPASALTVNLTVSQSGNFASSGETGSSKTVSVPTSGSATYTVSTVNDNTDEDNGSVTVTVNTGTGYTRGSSNSATVTVNDNDTAGVTVSQSARTVAENGGTATYTVGLDTRPAGQVIITVTAGGAAFVDGPGGTAKPKAKDTLTFTTSNWSTAQTVTITGQNDNIVNMGGERTRTITHTIEAGHGDGRKYRPVALTTFSIPSVTVTVTDDDAPSVTARLSSGSGATTLPEGAVIYFSLYLSKALGNSETVTVPLTIGGTATLGTDYRLACRSLESAAVATCNGINGNSPSITFDGAILNGRRRTAGPLHLETLGDNLSESNETVTLSLGGTTQTMTITDAPSSVTLSFFQDTFAATEGADVFQPTFTVTPASGRDITVPLIFTDITATGGADYTPVSQLVFEANGRTRYSIDIPVLEDTAFEGDETFKVAIDTANLPAGVTAGSITEATLTIEDNDVAPVATASFAAVSSSAAESAGTHNVTVNISPAPSGGFSLGYSVSGTATAGIGNDFTIQNAGSLTIAAGATSADIPVAINDDSAVENAETVILTLTSGTGYTLGSTTTHTLTITDNDDSTDPGVGGGGSDPTQITLAVYPNPIYEGRRATIHAELAHAVPSVVTLPLVFTTNDAETGDYVALATIVIDANEPFGTDWILTTKDDDMEDETFTVTFGALPAGFSRGTPASVDVIISEDENVTSIESPEEEIPEAFALAQNYPNPFNPSTAIEYELPTPQHVRLEVFDATGRSVGVLVDGIRPAGTHSVRFGADNLPSGLYVYRLQANGETLTRKMTLLR